MTEETQVTTEETLPEEEGLEEVVEEEGPTLEDIQKKLEEVEREKDQAEEKAKDLGARLTREQQEKAELYRYHRETLPKINKTFAEKWEESPEGAVTSQVEDKVKPVSQSLDQLKAQTFLNNVLIKNPKWAKYEAKAVALGDDFPQLTYSQEGVQKLFKMARIEDVEKEVEEQRSNMKAEVQKGRAYTEGSTPREKAKQKTKLSPSQRTVAKELGLTDDEYAKGMES
jgi:hypothetical protein